jgi:glutathione S-transferase
LGDQRFLVGDRVSLADLLLAPQIDFLAATPEGRALLGGTALAGWLERMNARPSMQRTQRPAALQGT